MLKQDKKEIRYTSNLPCLECGKHQLTEVKVVGLWEYWRCKKCGYTQSFKTR